MSETTPETTALADQVQAALLQKQAAESTTETEWKPPASQAELDRIISDRLARQKAAFKDYDDVKAKAAKLDQIEAANKTELEKAQGELTRWQTEAETWRGAAVASTVRALATTEFADPDDAVKSLDPAKYLDAGGVIDEAAIRADLAALLDAKPHYRVSNPSGARTPAPNRAQGSSGTSAPVDPRQQFAAFLHNQLQQ